MPHTAAESPPRSPTAQTAQIATPSSAASASHAEGRGGTRVVSSSRAPSYDWVLFRLRPPPLFGEILSTESVALRVSVLGLLSRRDEWGLCSCGVRHAGASARGAAAQAGTSCGGGGGDGGGGGGVLDSSKSSGAKRRTRSWPARASSWRRCKRCASRRARRGGAASLAQRTAESAMKMRVVCSADAAPDVAPGVADGSANTPMRRTTPSRANVSQTWRIGAASHARCQHAERSSHSTRARDPRRVVCVITSYSQSRSSSDPTKSSRVPESRRSWPVREVREGEPSAARSGGIPAGRACITRGWRAVVRAPIADRR